MKSQSLLLLFLISPFSFQAQTLFTYAENNITANEYLRAFNKVHPAPVANKEKKMREYLDLYINSKLKTHEALVRGYDTLPVFIEEFAALRNQVLENYMTDNESLDKLVNEAFDRSQKDIRVQHIFIPYSVRPGFSDSAVVKLKAQEAYMALMTGKSFDETALKYSADPSVAENKGHLGYITVFSLPYQYENLIYSLAPGKISAPYKSNSGYHIFKNAGERKAIGKMKAAQILLVIPPGSDSAAKKKYALLADSLYQRLLKRDDFAKLAQAFSNDNISAASGGVMPEFGVATYDPAFENIVFGLAKDGAISNPFLTKHGYHIVKRISLTPPPAIKDKKNLELMRLQVEKDARVNTAKEILYKKIMDKAGFKMSNFDPQQFQVFVDSTLNNKTVPAGNGISNSDVFFTLGNTTKLVADFIFYAQANRLKADGSGPKPTAQLTEEFKQQAAIEYYRDHLEDFNEEFAQQMKELKEGNLFFDIMMREVWSKAQADTAGQMEYFNRHKANYKWTYSADAVIFYCSDEPTAQSLKAALLKNPAAWRTIMENYSDKATIDSGRFEITKIPGAQKATAKAGLITAVMKNKDDNSATLAYIINIYSQPSQKSFSEARGDVINDYQEEIDKTWIGELRKKYGVKVNEAALKSIAK
jgi:peptidyl-prolyl cis-trans isomerase SurA